LKTLIPGLSTETDGVREKVKNILFSQTTSGDMILPCHTVPHYVEAGGLCLPARIAWWYKLVICSYSGYRNRIIGSP
jgi:hypothetical protein